MILQKLRRHQKRILVPLAAVVTITMAFFWGAGNDSVLTLFTGSRDPVVIAGTGYRRSELVRAVENLSAAAPGRLQQWAGRYDAKGFAAWVKRQVETGQLPAGGLSLLQYMALTEFLIPLEGAREAGLSVSDAQLVKELRKRIDFHVVRQDEPDRAKAYASYLREHNMNQARFEEACRDILLLTKYMSLVASVAQAPASVEDAYLQHCMDAQTVDLDVVAFPVKDFEGKIEPVTIEDLRVEYARRAQLPRTRPYRPIPQYPNFVMQQPVPGALYTEPLARVEYLLAETANFKKGVEIKPQEIADYYDENKDKDFRVEPETKKEEDADAEPEKPDASASAPALKPLDEVRGEIVKRITETKASEAAKKALDEAIEAYNAGESARETLIDHGPPRPGGEESTLAGAPSRPASEKNKEEQEEQEEKEEKPTRALSLAEVAKTHALSIGRTELLDEKAMKALPVFEGLSFGGGIFANKVFGETPEARGEITGCLSEAKETKAGHIAVTLRAHHASRKQTFAESREKLDEDLADSRARSLARTACVEVREELVKGSGVPTGRVVTKEKGVKARDHFRAAALLSVGEASAPTYDGDEKVYRLLVLTARTVPDRAAFMKDRMAVEQARRIFTQGAQ